MASMLGVQRPSVTSAVGILQKARLIQHRNGRLDVPDREGLEAVSCECYGIVRNHFAWLGANG